MVGACHTRLGHHEEAKSHCEAALQLSRRQKDAFGEADSLESLGAIAHATGRHTEAVDHYAQALKCWRELDNTYRQAGVLAAVGDTHDELGRPDQALAAWREAIDLYRAQNLHSVADRVNRRAAKYSSTVDYPAR
jgi:tetratricopeptide (TPR) repeat protein